MLNPPLDSPGQSGTFDPGSDAFGIWSYTDQAKKKASTGGTATNGDYAYGDNSLNSPANMQRVRVWPLRDRAGASARRVMMLAHSRWSLLFLLAQCTACASEPEIEHPGDAGADSRWAAWPMPNSQGLGLPNEQSYEVLGAGEEEVVHDRVTGLDWQRSIDAASLAWSAAGEYCQTLRYAGLGDWRLPTRVELVSLIDLSRGNPALALSAFPSAPSEWYWTATADSVDSTRAWYVYFYFGYPDVDDGAVENRVRCVRSATPLSPALQHYEIEAQVVRDSSTGLVWQREVVDQSLSAAQAAEYCAALVVGDRSGFRVPTMKELETLVDDRRFAPAIDPAAFPNTPSESFWSSSAWSGTTNLAWHVRFDLGNALYDLASEPLRVRCVL